MKKEKAAPFIGTTEVERSLFALQHSVMCFVEAFYRQIAQEFVRIVGDPHMSAQDCVILNVIRLGRRPKSIVEIQNFTNRSDISNIQYSVRKLTKAGLVQQSHRKLGRNVHYQLTKKGEDITTEYIKSRREITAMLPFEAEKFVKEADAATQLVLLMTGIYEHRSRTASVR